MSMLDRLFSLRVPEGWTEHKCEAERPWPDGGPYGIGGAVSAIARSPYGSWWAWAGTEYATAILFCPFCGQRLGEE